MLENVRLGFIGGGNMGEALVKGLVATGKVPAERMEVYDVSVARMDHLEKTYGIGRASAIGPLCESCGVILLAVKPQNMAEVLAELRSRVDHRPLLISIAAGVPIATLAKDLPEGVPVVRVMPNTPALVLQGASALARGASVSDGHMELALALFGAVGKAVEVDEKLMDAVTGLSGSGPAYVLLFLESLVDGGVLMGLPRPVARDLAVQTLLGTARMLEETGHHPAQLKDMITSPGGTTVHGLRVLENRGLRGACMEAVEAAAERSAALGGK